MPPGRAAGQRCERSRAATSAFVRDRGSPPYADTTERPPVVCGANTIVSSETQAPPRGSAASQIVDGAPPETGALRSLPRAKKPIHFPSGEKKGLRAPSDSGTSDRDETIQPPQVEAAAGAAGHVRELAPVGRHDDGGAAAVHQVLGREEDLALDRRRALRGASAQRERPRSGRARGRKRPGEIERDLLAPSLTTRRFCASTYSGAWRRVDFLRRVIGRRSSMRPRAQFLEVEARVADVPQPQLRVAPQALSKNLSDFLRRPGAAAPPSPAPSSGRPQACR